MRIFELKIKRYLATILCVTVMFTSFNYRAQKADALWDTVATTVTTMISSIMDVLETPLSVMSLVWEKIQKVLLPIAKMAAVILVKTIMQKIIAGENGGSAHVIADWDDYLYLTPAQRAQTYMNTFYSQTTKGRLGTTTEGVNRNFDTYMVTQANNEIRGTKCKLTVQEYAENPSELFEGGNMKGFTASLQPCNNPYIFPLIAKAAYEKQLEKEQAIAKNQQTNGFLPKKDELGNILAPATLFSAAMEGTDKMFGALITSARDVGEVAMYAGGQLASQLGQYYLGDPKGKKAVTAKANKPLKFNATYTGANGLGLQVK